MDQTECLPPGAFLSSLTIMTKLPGKYSLSSEMYFQTVKEFSCGFMVCHLVFAPSEVKSYFEMAGATARKET